VVEDIRGQAQHEANLEEAGTAGVPPVACGVGMTDDRNALTAQLSATQLSDKALAARVARRLTELRIFHVTGDVPRSREELLEIDRHLDMITEMNASKRVPIDLTAPGHDELERI
jgi:hypothetical protein